MEELLCVVIDLMKLLIVASSSHKYLLKSNISWLAEAPGYDTLPFRQIKRAFLNMQRIFIPVYMCSETFFSNISLKKSIPSGMF